MILLLINVLLLVLGCLLDMAPSILITTPILLPVVMKFGVDPVHFGMIMLLNLGIGLCHPPVGATLFVGCAVGRVRDGGGHAGDLAVLRGHVPRADAGHLYPGDLAVAAARPLPLSVGALSVAALSVAALNIAAAHIEKLTISVISKRGGRTAAGACR